MSVPYDIVHHPIPGRFSTQVDSHLAHLDYDLADGIMHITHTVVPSEIGGRGIAGALMRAAAEHARFEGLKLSPDCSYAADYLGKHPEYADLRA